MTWIRQLRREDAGRGGGDKGSIRLDLDNELQPDAYLMIEPQRGGQARISEDDYVEVRPELVAEIASSSVSYDWQETPFVPAQRRPRIRRLARPRPRNRLVRAP